MNTIAVDDGEPVTTAGSQRTRVLIAEDSWHYAQALEAALTRNSDLDIAGIAYTAEDLLDAVAKDPPTVVLLDLDLPEMGGLAACELLGKHHPDIAIVVVTGLANDDLARRCLALGARSFVVKHDRHDPERIAAAVRSAARGDLLIDRDLQGLLAALAARERDPADQAGLTARERDVLPLIAEGMQNKEIARQLGIAEQTVRNHLSNIYRKLGAKNRTQMTTEARRRGIIE